jgi:hypothetical protein
VPINGEMFTGLMIERFAAERTEHARLKKSARNPCRIGERRILTAVENRVDLKRVSVKLLSCP